MLSHNQLVILLTFGGLVNALPIGSHNMVNEHGMIYMGLLGFLGAGVLLGACVCCRRRKYGFESYQLKTKKEFRDDSATVEIAPTLSTAVVSTASMNAPTFNQGFNDAHNNNGPLSIADMQNIENNNAVGYIENINVYPIANGNNDIVAHLNFEAQTPQLQTNSLAPTHDVLHNYSITNATVELHHMPSDVVEDIPYTENNKAMNEVNYDFLGTNTSDSESESSSLRDTNSVEEALLALDNAISGEDIIQQIQLSEVNSVSLKMNDLSSDGDMEELENKAKMIVDDVLNKALNSVEEILAARTQKLIVMEEEPKCCAFKIPTEDDFSIFFNNGNGVTSTPQISLFGTNYEHTNKKISTNLFGSDGGDNMGELAIMQVIEEGKLILEDQTFDVTVNDDVEAGNEATVNGTYTCIASKTFDANNDFDNDVIQLEDIDIKTPLNTPCELNFPTENWNRFIESNRTDNLESNTIQSSNLNNTIKIDDQTFEYECADGDGWGNDDIEDNEENLNSAYEELRKQLTKFLPQHSQSGVSALLDDEKEFVGESESTKLESILNAIDPMASASCSGYKQNEMTINYRRALSPIIEENEDDLTNTTFGLVENNSTSTACCIGSGEEVALGVTKTLMTSNDTLFNFDDVLNDDRDEGFTSPRALLHELEQSNCNATKIIHCEEQICSSPDCCTVSSDVTPTLDGTFTATNNTSEDLKTCIARPKKPNNNSSDTSNKLEKSSNCKAESRSTVINNDLNDSTNGNFLLSGEEDPWMETSANETKLVPVPSNKKEWDSDVDDSNSSEEFMYYKSNDSNINDSNATKNNNSNSSLSSLRSALKDPEKIIDMNNGKQKRNVAFEKHQPGGGYKKPYFDEINYERERSGVFYGHDKENIDQDDTISRIFNSDFDGFKVTSSEKPFNGRCTSSYNTHYTWPTDGSDWPITSCSLEGAKHIIHESFPSGSATVNIHTNPLDSDGVRSDSGVGESMEMLSEPTSLRDYHHTHNKKSQLMHPVKHNKQHVVNDKDSMKNIGETFSSTGSIDSISSGDQKENESIASIVKDPNNGTESSDNLPNIINNIIPDCSSQKQKKHSDSTDDDSGIESIMKTKKKLI